MEEEQMFFNGNISLAGILEILAWDMLEWDI